VTPPSPQIFDNIRVLDLITREAGATIATSYLADMGADVIKIDRPGEPEPAMAGHYVKDGINLPYKVKGRNKRHITLDVSKPQGRDIFHRLVADADVVAENFSPGTMEGWGHDWETLRSLNPRLIFCRISPFGQTGPYKDRRIDGRGAEAFGGLAHLDGEPERQPLHSQADVGGTIAGIWAAYGTILALLRRDAQGGQGQVIDVSLWEPIYRQQTGQIPAYSASGTAPKRSGSRKSGGIPWVDTHETKDGGFFTYSAVTRASMRDQMLAMNMFLDPRFKDFPSAAQNADDYHGEAVKWMKTRTLDEVDDAFQRYECSSSPVTNAETLIDNPHLLAREDVITVDDPDLGPVRMQGIVPKFSKTPGQVRWSGERPGARNEEVYGQLLGLGKKELAELQKAEVI
jgi:crotonobetainyl-CoA:carnitine CoA-transferase CaiB-like acyl-CoA transferase